LITLGTRENSMRTIEAQLHDILLDLVPDQYSAISQAKIVAEAADIYYKANKANTRTSAAKRGETGLVKALWTALASLSLEEDYEYDEPSYVDGFGMDPNQIVRSAVSKSNKVNFKMSKKAMEILNDEDLSVFLDEEIENEYNFDDATDDYLHPVENFKSPGDPKHHTDSRIIPGF